MKYFFKKMIQKKKWRCRQRVKTLRCNYENKGKKITVNRTEQRKIINVNMCVSAKKIAKKERQLGK